MIVTVLSGLDYFFGIRRRMAKLDAQAEKLETQARG